MLSKYINMLIIYNEIIILLYYILIVKTFKKISEQILNMQNNEKQHCNDVSDNNTNTNTNTNTTTTTTTTTNNNNNNKRINIRYLV